MLPYIKLILLDIADLKLKNKINIYYVYYYKII